MFLKQYNYKPRSGSGSEGSAVDTSSNAQPEAPSTAAARRRSSATEKFAGLSNVKRSSQDTNLAERKNSFADQKPGGGILGGMWNSFTKGTN